MSYIEKKVYCGDCKYQLILKNYLYTKRCVYEKIIDDFYPVGALKMCEYKNTDGNCKDYKRKWWKIWA